MHGTVEQTFIMLKPDALQRALVGPILSRFEARGLRFRAMKLMLVSDELAARHYAEHQGKRFYDGLVRHVTSGAVIAAVLEGPKAIEAVRRTLGSTNPLEAAPGTIRGDFAITIGPNLVHASATPEDARREIALWFSPEELISYDRGIDRWIFAED